MLKVNLLVMLLPLGILMMMMPSDVGCDGEELNAKMPLGILVMRDMRRIAAQRQRGIIMNNDGGDALGMPADRPVTPETMLEQRTSALVGAHVGTISYCTGHGFGFHLHNTQVGWVLDGYDGGDRLRALIEQGNDPLKVMVDFCHANGMEIFRSQRMNDCHDHGHRPDSPHPEFSPFKQQHPEYLMDTIDAPGVAGRPWTAVDYTHPEVREAMYRYLEEVCQNYDVDGIEMDFFRHLGLFKSVASSQEELDMMTRLVRRVREMTEREGQQRGRPILVAIRVPDSVEYCQGIGLDLERWLAEGLVDILVLSGYFRLNPWEYSVKLGHRYGVQVYPCLSESRQRGDKDNLRNSTEAYRARAVNVWASGADGVYTFNYFDPEKPFYKEGHSPETLIGLDKVYFVAVRGFPMVNYYLPNGMSYVNRPTLSPEHPVKIQPGAKITTALRCYEDFAAAQKQDLEPVIKLELQVDNLETADALEVQWNGQDLAEGDLKGDCVTYKPSLSHMRDGDNEAVISLSGDHEGAVTVSDLRLWVRYSD